MYIPKRYGMSKVDRCPFCNKTATTNNSQGVPVCLEHKSKLLPDMKCTCGGFLDIRNGKFGPYFNCFKCGNVNFRKALEINPPLESLNNQSHNNSSSSDNSSKDKPKDKPKIKKDFVIRSDELDCYFS